MCKRHEKQLRPKFIPSVASQLAELIQDPTINSILYFLPSDANSTPPIPSLWMLLSKLMNDYDNPAAEVWSPAADSTNDFFGVQASTPLCDIPVKCIQCFVIENLTNGRTKYCRNIFKFKEQLSCLDLALFLAEK